MSLSERIHASPRLLLLGSFGVTSVVNYGFSLAMGWMLVPGDFGVLAFAQTMLLVVGLLLQSGIPWALAREVANDKGPRRAALIRGALLANVSLALVVSGVILALYILGPLQPGLETSAVALSVTGSLPFIAVVTVAYASAQGVEKFGTMGALQGSEVVTKALAGTAFVLAGHGAGGAVFGFLVGAVLSAVIGMIVLRRTFLVGLRRELRLPDYRSAAPIFGALLGIVLLLNLHLLAVKLLSPEERALTGYYQVAIILANTPYYLVAAVVLPVLFVQLSRYQTISMTAERTGKALRLVALFIIPIEIALILAPELPVRTFFPDAYLPAATYLRFLAAGVALVLVIAVLSTAFQAIGRAAVPARILLVGVAIETVILWMLVPRVTSTAAAAIFVIFAGAGVAMLGGMYLRSLPAEDVYKVMRWSARYLTALLTATGTAGIIMTMMNAALTGLIAGGVAYAAMLVLTGLLPAPPASTLVMGPLRRALASRS